MTLAAGRCDVLGRQNRLLPRQRAVVRFLERGGCALAAMAHHASELVDRVRNDGMFAKGLSADIRQAGFLLRNVTGRAAIDDTEFRQPHLLKIALEVPPQSSRIAAAADHPQVALLIMPPLAKIVF